MKKVLFTILMLVLTLSSYAYDFEVNGIYYDILNDGKEVGVTNGTNKYSDNVVVPSTVTYSGVTYNVTEICGMAFYGSSNLTSVKISNGVENISKYAFYNCSKLSSVEIPASVKEIAKNAFNKCNMLTSVTIDSDTLFSVIYTEKNTLGALFGVQVTNYIIGNNVKKIGDYTFYNCNKIKSITIPNSVTSIGESAFWGCSGLKEVHITDIDKWVEIEFGNNLANPLSYATNLYLNGKLVTNAVLTKATKIGDHAFHGYTRLTSIEIPNSVTSIGNYAFRNCSSLTSVTIPNSVTSIGNYAFHDCSSLTSVTIPNSVTSIGDGAFDYCSDLTSITIPNSVTSIGDYTFYNCKKIKSITIPNSVISIGSYAFSYCSGLTSVTIPNSVTSIGKEAFMGLGLSGLKEVHITDIDKWAEIEFASYDANPLCFAKNLYLNGELVTNAVLTKATKIGEYAFRNCSGLTSITIPNSVTSIGTLAFYNCSNLTSVTIPNSVTSIGGRAFYECSGLKEVHITDIDKWAEIEFASYDANPLYYAKNLYLNGKLVTNAVLTKATKIESKAFDGCSSLTSVTIPNSVTSIGSDAFYGCSGLTSITIPNSVTSIVSSAFCGCSGLTSIKVEKSNTKYDSRDNCNAIIETATNTLIAGFKNTIIPNSVTSIGDFAFNGCSDLTSITIPNCVTSIGYAAFSNCSCLTSITIPNSVTSIGSYAFDNCSGLASIKVEEGNTKYDSRDNCNAIIETATNTLIAGCKNTIIPNSVTIIGEGAFSGRGDLTSITIPNSVTSIGYAAFWNCSGLKDVYNYATTPQHQGSHVFYGTPKDKTLHIIKGYKSAYEKSYWSEDDFTILEDLEPTAVKNIKKYKDNNLDNNIYNWQGFKAEGQINIKNRKKFVK